MKDALDLDRAKNIFEPLGISVTPEGERHLGAVLGSESFKAKYLADKVSMWVKELDKLTEIASEEPQLAYQGFVKGLCPRYNYVMRTIPNIEVDLQPLEVAIESKFIPALLGRHLSPLERDIVALPLRHGGLGIVKPSEIATDEYERSQKITDPLVSIIVDQIMSLQNYNSRNIDQLKLEVKDKKEENYRIKFLELSEQLPAESRSSLVQAKERGASAWLSALPLESQGYVLNKREFRDAVSLRYGWNIEGIPLRCACGCKNGVNHALTCSLGGYVHLRHNNLRDLIAQMLCDSRCRDVEVEPGLLPVNPANYKASTNTQDDARLDIAATGFNSAFERTFFDVRVTHPGCETNIYKPLSQLYRDHEQACAVEV